MTPTDFLSIHHACEDGKTFAMKYATMAEVWDNCPHTDWLLWILRKLGPVDKVTAVRFACWCARETPIGDGRTVWDLLTDRRSRDAVEVTEGWCNGINDIDDVRKARPAAYAAYAAATADATAYAAYAAATAAATAATATAATATAYAAATADAAATAAATATAYATARPAARKAQADHLRTLFANPFRATTQPDTRSPNQP
jgi:hypothetical protein